MATAPRYYLIAEDGTIHRLARSAFYDVILQKVAVPVPEPSGQRVRLATIHVRLDGRRAVRSTLREPPPATRENVVAAAVL